VSAAMLTTLDRSFSPHYIEDATEGFEDSADDQ